MTAYDRSRFDGMLYFTLFRRIQGSLQHDYDALLDMQLKDQELFYEKLIARETVRLLETGGYAEYVCDNLASGAQEEGGSTHNLLSEDDLAAIEAMKVINVAATLIILQPLTVNALRTCAGGNICHRVRVSGAAAGVVLTRRHHRFCAARQQPIAADTKSITNSYF